eukprot:857684-Rhodomonas_salina.1
MGVPVPVPVRLPPSSPPSLALLQEHGQWAGEAGEESCSSGLTEARALLELGRVLLAGGAGGA